MAKSKSKKVAKSSKSKSEAAANHKFVPKKAYPKMDQTVGAYAEHGGVRALVVKSLPKGGATAAQVAQRVAKLRKGYTATAALNCLRWLGSKGYVARLH